MQSMQVELARKRDAEATRARILEAAKIAFSQTGYSHTGIREIATMAGTSSTLVLRYFGSKIGLFEVALRDSMPPDELISLAPADFPPALIRALYDSSEATRPMMMMAMASGDSEAADIAAKVFTELSIVPVGAALGHPDGHVRALKLSILAIGFVFFVKHMPLSIFCEEDIAKVRDWFGRSVADVTMP